MTDTAIADAAAAGEAARPRIDGLAAELLAKIARAQRASDEDPFGNPVLSVALGIARRMGARSGSSKALSARQIARTASLRVLTTLKEISRPMTNWMITIILITPIR